MSSSDLDFALALSLQNEYDNKEIEIVDTKKTNLSKGIVDEHWELADPNPNIHQLFIEYDSTFFWSKLAANGVAVDWSNKMTLCAGVCSYQNRSGFCSIRLSQPLLKLRPRRDLVQTLLHEMIHAYLFVTHNYKDHDAHGPQFLHHMHRINQASGAKITVYHSFHHEVKEYQQHWWKCNGPCQKRPPYYGIVMRAMNRPPSQRDPWWSEHQRTCGGTYIKIKEPEGYGKKARRKGGGDKGKNKASGSKDIRELLGGEKKMSGGSKADHSRGSALETPFKAFEGCGFTLGGGNQQKVEKVDLRSKILEAAERRKTKNELKGLPSLQQGAKRKGKDTFHGLSNSCEVKGPTQRNLKDYTSTIPKKPRLDDCIVIADSPPEGKVDRKDEENPSISKTPSIIIENRDEGIGNVVNLTNETNERNPSINISTDQASSSSVVTHDNTAYVIDDDTKEDTDPVKGTPPPDDWFLNIDDYRTCPVCGMGNIPSAIINTHITLCLEAEEQFQIIDRDEIL